MSDYQRIIRDYVCAVCWGQLTAHIEGRDVIVECANYGIEHYGFVSRRYVEKRRAESLFELLEARKNLKDILHLPEMDTDKAIKELFG